jgi:hypothetical protein
VQPPTVIINGPTSQTLPDQYITVPAPSSSTSVGQGSSTGTGTGSSGSASRTGASEQTTVPDAQTPLAGGDADAEDGPNLLLLLSVPLFLLVVVIGGWLLLRRPR